MVFSGTALQSYQQLQEEKETLSKQYFLASSLTGLSQPSPATTVSGINNNTKNVSTYQNSSLGINIQYPSDWQVEERINIDNNNNIASSIKFSSPSKNDLMVVSVYTQNLSSLPVEQQQQNITLDSLTRTGINAEKKTLTTFNFLI